jgi:HlyD family secretion protein
LIRKYLLPLLALAGVALAMAVVFLGKTAPRWSEPGMSAPRAPYASYIAGAGLIEASTGNIAVGTPISGIIVAVYVKSDDRVNPGDPLFKIDDRDLQARLPVAVARLREAEIKLGRAKDLLRIGETLKGGFVSGEELSKRRFEVESTEAAVRTLRAESEEIGVEIERRTIRAPVGGRVLQIVARVGEFGQSTGSTPLLVLGDDTRLYVRADIDEYDAWRFRRESAAQAFVRGNPALNTPLQFERIEPLVVPKRSLTGDSTERTDTRVLQVIFSFDHASLPVFVGQQVDVFIEAPPVEEVHGDVPAAVRQHSAGSGP